MNTNFLYALVREDTNDIFYVGKTSNKLRKRLTQHLWCAKKSGKKNKLYAFLRNLMTLGIGVGIIELARNLEDINKAEIEMIAQMKAANIKLKNVQPGGEGQPKGYVFKLRFKSPKGIRPLNFINNPPKPYVHTAAIKAKRRKTFYENKACFKKIKAYNIDTQQVFEFESYLDASKFLKCPASNISRQINKMSHLLFKGVWVLFRGDLDLNKITGSRIVSHLVYSVEVGTDKKEQFLSVKSAAKELKLDRKGITRSIKSGKAHKGRRWFYGKY